MNTNVLLIACPDERGLVSRITGVLSSLSLNIVTNSEFVEPDTARFFMRTEVEGELDEAHLLEELRTQLPAGSDIRLAERREKRIVLFATKESHCLGDLLIRCEFNDLPAEILAVVSNHEVLRDLTEKFGHPFHYVPHAGLSREEHEERVIEQLAPYQTDYLVLAKYMRILTPAFVARFPNRIVNIHHSFLPAFAGASPYRQAYERGVKIIGATAHFVNESLDEGPIIAQSVNPVGHQHGPRDLARAGRDIEKIVLARALRLVMDDRVFISGNKTIIFD